MTVRIVHVVRVMPNPGTSLNAAAAQEVVANGPLQIDMTCVDDLLAWSRWHDVVSSRISFEPASTLPRPHFDARRFQHSKGYADAPRIPCYRGARRR